MGKDLHKYEKNGDMEKRKEYEYTDDVTKHFTDLRVHVRFVVLVHYNLTGKSEVPFLKIQQIRKQ